MIIMGIDVSLARTGIAVLQDGGFIGHEVIHTSEKLPRYRRLGSLRLDAELHMLAYRPDIIVIETSAGWQTQASYMRKGKRQVDSRVSIEAMAQARAAVLIATNSYGRARVIETDSHEARETVCANRNAGKAQVQENLRQRGYILPTMANGKVDPDVADAAALALSVWATERLLAMRKEVKT